MIAAGHTNPEIATALGVTIDGAKWHVSEIISKLGVASREEAAEVWVMEHRPAVRAHRFLASVAPSAVWAKVALGGGAMALVVAGVLTIGALNGNWHNPGAPPPHETSTRIPASAAATSSVGTQPAGSPPDEERIIGEAIDALAQLLGIDRARIEHHSIESVNWPSDCLGVEPPGLACAQVVTPGVRVWLYVGRQPQIIHASAAGKYALAPLVEGEREIASVDLSSGRVMLVPLPSNDEMGSQHRVVPGSYVAGPLAELQQGDRVSIAVAGQLPGDETGLIVWLVPVD